MADMVGSWIERCTGPIICGQRYVKAHLNFVPKDGKSPQTLRSLRLEWGLDRGLQGNFLSIMDLGA